MERFQNIGVIKNEALYEVKLLDSFLKEICELREQAVWEKTPIINLFKQMIPDFHHKETGKYLDGKM